MVIVQTLQLREGKISDFSIRRQCTSQQHANVTEQSAICLKCRETDSSKSLPAQQCRDSGHLRTLRGIYVSPTTNISVETGRFWSHGRFPAVQVDTFDSTWLCGLWDPGGTRITFEITSEAPFSEFFRRVVHQKGEKCLWILPTLGWSSEMFHDPPFSEQETFLLVVFSSS